MKVSKEIINELETLFEFVGPAKLREDITEVYFNYLQGDAIKCGSEEDFKDRAGNFYFLIQFLELAEKSLKVA